MGAETELDVRAAHDAVVDSFGVIMVCMATAEAVARRQSDFFQSQKRRENFVRMLAWLPDCYAVAHAKLKPVSRLFSAARSAPYRGKIGRFRANGKNAHEAALEFCNGWWIGLLVVVEPDNKAKASIACKAASVERSCLHSVEPAWLEPRLPALLAYAEKTWPRMECDFRRFDNELEWESEKACAAAAAGGDKLSADDTVCASANDARDKFIYDQACKGMTWREIRVALEGKSRKWAKITRDNGVKAAAYRYAARHKLPKPALRKAGRKPR